MDNVSDGLPRRDSVSGGKPRRDSVSGGLPRRDSVSGGKPRRDSVSGGLPVRDSVSGGLPRRDRVPGELPVRDSVPGGLPVRDSVSGGLPRRDRVPGGLPVRDSVPGGLPVRDSVSGGLPGNGLHDYVPTKDSSESCCRSTDASYTCDHCGKHYESRSGLFKHTRSSHPQVDQTNQQIYCKESLCDYACSRVYQLRTHLTETHGLEMRQYSKVFSSNEGIYICQCSCMCCWKKPIQTNLKKCSRGQ